MDQPLNTMDLVWIRRNISTEEAEGLFRTISWIYNLGDKDLIRLSNHREVTEHDIHFLAEILRTTRFEPV